MARKPKTEPEMAELLKAGKIPIEPITAEVVLESSPVEPPAPAEMQLTVLENTSVFRWNFDEIKTRLLTGIQKYSGLTVTDENLPDMEKTAREIASLRSKVNAFRLETKRKLNEPADKFDTEVKELTQIITQAEEPLKKQLQVYEDSRVTARETSYMEFARKTAAVLGVRDTTFTGWQVPSKLTNRTVTETAAKTEIVAAMEQIKAVQDAADHARAEIVRQDEERKRRETEFMTMADLMCRNLSAHAGLKTPVMLADVKHLITPDCGAEMIDEVINRAVQRQKRIEDAAAAPPPTPPTPPPAPPAGPPPIPTAPPPSYGPPPAAPPRQEPQKYDVVLKFPGVTAVQAGALRLWLSDHKMVYEVISQEKTGGQS